MEAWQIALGWVLGGPFLILCYIVACTIKDAEIAAEEAAADARVTVLDATYGGAS